LGSVLARNIRTMEMRRDREEVTATLEVRVADAITHFTGSMRFVYLHLALFGLWVIFNLGLIPSQTYLKFPDQPAWVSLSVG